jgi:serine/threonine protein kinase
LLSTIQAPPRWRILRGLIVRRALKSANLLVTNDKRVVVCDFTLSRVSGQMLTHSHMGTTGFIAPEAVIGEVRASERARARQPASQPANPPRS